MVSGVDWKQGPRQYHSPNLGPVDLIALEAGVACCNPGGAWVLGFLAELTDRCSKRSSAAAFLTSFGRTNAVACRIGDEVRRHPKEALIGAHWAVMRPILCVMACCFGEELPSESLIREMLYYFFYETPSFSGVWPKLLLNPSYTKPIRPITH